MPEGKFDPVAVDAGGAQRFEARAGRLEVASVEGDLAEQVERQGVLRVQAQRFFRRGLRALMVARYEERGRVAGLRPGIGRLARGSCLPLFGIRVLLPVDQETLVISGESFGQPAAELGIRFGDALGGDGGDDLRVALSLPVELERRHYLGEAVGLGQVVDDERALMVGDHHAVGTVGTREGWVQVRDAPEIPALQREVELAVVLALPLRVRDVRFVLGQPLREPARDAVLRELDREDVAEFVPEHLLPVCLAAGGRHRGDQLAKAGPLRLEPRQADGPHRVMLALGEELDGDRVPGREAVFLAVEVPRLLHEWRDVMREDRRLLLVHQEAEVAAGDRDILLRDHLLEEGEEVVVHHVEGIAVPCLAERRQALLLQAQAQVAAAERYQRALVVRIDGDCLVVEIHGLAVAVLLDGVFAHLHVEVAVARVLLEHRLPQGFVAGAVVLEIATGGEQGLRFQVRRVDGQRLA